MIVIMIMMMMIMGDHDDLDDLNDHDFHNDDDHGRVDNPHGSGGFGRSHEDQPGAHSTYNDHHYDHY